jgi:hypothetical protein
MLTGQAVSATWSTPVALTSWERSSAGGLVALGSSTAIAVYTEESGYSDVPNRIYARRSTNSGASWRPPVLLSGDGRSPAIAGRGSSADVVWTASNGRVRYARSTDGGATFGTSLALSSSGREAWRPTVARGPNGRVAVAWEDDAGAVRVRVSKNGGASFGSVKTLTTVSTQAGTAVAVGKGVVYVAYVVGNDDQKVRVKRSRDSGASWSSAVAITDNGAARGVSITAAGSHAYVAYTGPNSGWGQVRYRRTTDKGATWSKLMDLSPAAWSSSNPHISLKGGVLRAVFDRCTPEWDICGNERVFYRESANGTSWAPAQRVSPTNLWGAWDPSVGFAGRILVLYNAEQEGGIQPHVRRGTP